MEDYKGILQALKRGHHLGCWASGGGIAIVEIRSDTVLGGGEDGTIEEALKCADADWLQFEEHKLPYDERMRNRTSFLTGSAVCDPNGSLLDKLDYWVKKKSGFLRVDYESHNKRFIVMLDGYDKDTESVIQTATGKTLMEAIEAAFNAPPVPKEK